MNALFRRWLGKIIGRRKARGIHCARRVLPGFEELEDRTLPSGGFPYVESINRTSPTGPVTNASSVSYTVTFSEVVTGVAAGDFQLALIGTATGTVSQVTPVSGAVYTVTVNGVSGNGTLGLNLVDNGSIHDVAGDPLTQQNVASFQPPQTFAAGSSPFSVALGDVNGDGKPDLAVANAESYTVSVLLGNGNGTFQAQQTYAAALPLSLALGDVNGDGKPDIAVANAGDPYAGNANKVSVLLGNGNGTFQAQHNYATGAEPYSVAIGDVNRDGKPDLVLANAQGNTVSVLFGNGDGTFQAQQTYAAGPKPLSLALGDVNGDGIPDIAVANATSANTVSVLLGNGNGTFQAPQPFATGALPKSVAMGDVNGDGKPDLVVCNYLSNTVSILLGNGNGTFQTQQPFAAGADPRSVALGDVNGDGKLDVVVVGPEGTVSVLLGDGNGNFLAPQQFAAGYQPQSVVLGDLNGDGKLDVVVPNQNRTTVSVLLGNDKGNFTGQVYAITSGAAVTLALTSLPSTLTAGQGITFTVTALDASNNTVPGYNGTVNFSKTDNGAGSFVPANYTFLPADGGVHVFTAGVGLVSAGVQSITATDTAISALSVSTSLSVLPAAPMHLAIDAPTGIQPNSAFNFTVTAQDQFGNTAMAYAGTVGFVSSDAQAQLPIDATLTNDIGVFSAVLRTPGKQTLTATDIGNATISGGAAVNAVDSSGIAPFVQSINRTTPAGPVTNANSVTYTVTFSEPVTGVDTADFQLALSGTAAGTISQVTPVSGSVYTVAVSSLSGNGTLGLNLVDNGSIFNLAGNPLIKQNALAAFQPAQQLSVGSYPNSAAVGDVNGDGKPDLVAANGYSDTVSVLLANGNGSFQAQQTFAVGFTPTSAAIDDLNGDGKPDIVTTDFHGNAVSVLLGNGNGTFQTQQIIATGIYPISLAIGDVNGDGLPDIIVANSSSDTVSVLLGNGNGTFQAQQTIATGAEPVSVALGDVNGDGIPDIVVANRASNTVSALVSVLLGNGNGTFQAQQPFATGSGSVSVAVADVNGDGKLDLALGNSSPNIAVLLGNGNGTFQAEQTFAAGSGPYAVLLGDVNGDGKIDLVVTNGANATVSILLGNGNGAFQTQQTFAAGNKPGSVVLADLNGDGRPDLVVNNKLTHGISVLLANGNGNFTGQIYTLTTGATTNLAISGLPATATIHSSLTFTLTALGPANNTVPSYTGTVHFSTTDTALGSGVPADYTFVPADGGVHVFTAGATLVSPGVQTINASDKAIPALSTAAPVLVVPTKLAITGLPATATAGNSLTFTLTAQDPSNNTVPDYTGTVHFSTTDTGAAVVLPADYTFVPADGGVHVFTSGAILVTSGIQTINATDTTIKALSVSASLSVMPQSAAQFAVNVPIRIVPNNAFSFTVTAQDQFGNKALGYTDTVKFASSDPLALFPVGSTLTNGVGTFSATLKTGGVQAITATDNGNAAVTGSVTVKAVISSGIHPFVVSINRTSPAGAATNASTLTYTVTFSEPVTGVNPTDFALALTGTATGAVSQVTPVSGFLYMVTIGGVTGNGTLGLNLVDNGSIYNLAGNPLTTPNGQAAFPPQQPFATGVNPVAVATASLTGDGIFDLVAANFGSSSVSVLLGNGNGTFQAQQTFGTTPNPNSVVIGDVNGDGIPDLVVANAGRNSLSVLLGNGNGTFQAQQTISTGQSSQFVAIGDVNGDGKADLAVSGTSGLRLLLGNGNGTFQAPQFLSVVTTGPSPYAVAMGDVNGDGYTDLVVTNEGEANTVSVLLGNGNGSFQTCQSFLTGSEPLSPALADVNGDGIPDIVVANAGGDTVSVLLGLGNGSFLPQQTVAVASSPGGPNPVAIGDVNGDGKPDLVVRNGSHYSVSVLPGNGDGTFQPQQTFAVGPTASSIVLADLNGDGRTDLAFTIYNGLKNDVGVLLNSTNGNFTGQVFTITTATLPVITGLPATATVHSPVTFTVTAIDSAGHTVASYTGTVHFNTSDTGAGSVVPADYTFTPADGGVHVFTAGAIVVSPGIQTINALDTAIGTVSASASVSVIATAATHFAVIAPTPLNLNTPFSFTVTALDQFGNTATGYTGIVDFSSSDSQALLPINTTLKRGEGVFSATFNTQGKQTVTATDSTDSAITGSAVVLAVKSLGSGPFVISIDRASPVGPITTAGSVTFTVTFSKTVTGVDPNDFQLALGGTAAATVSQVTPASGSVYNVTVSGITGNGRLGLNLVDDSTIRDLVGMPLTQQNATAAFQPQQTFATGSGPFAVTLGDLTADGIPDIVVANAHSNTVSVLLGNGNGTFQTQQTFATGSHPRSVALGDANGDGIPDIVVANQYSNNVSVLLGNGNGTFQAQQTFAAGTDPQPLALGDLNGDGKLDIVVANENGGNVSVLLGNGNGTFQAQQTFAAGSEPLSLLLADVNGDGKSDLVLANFTQQGAVTVLLGNGNGTFQGQHAFNAGTQAESVVLADVNGDSKPDLVVANSSGVIVLLGTGDGTYQAPQTVAIISPSPLALAVGDVNGDGKADIIEDGFGSSVDVLLGNGNGTFQARQTIATGTGAIPVALGDINGDGRPDLVVGNYGSGTVSVLLNSANGNFTGQVYTVNVVAATHFVISNTPSNITAGGNVSFTVAAEDSAGNTVAGYTGTVQFTSSDSNTLLPPSATLTAGVGVFTATLITAGTQTLTVTDTANSSLTGTSGFITVAPTTANHFAISAPSSVSAGTPFAFTITAEDPFDNLANYTATLRFTSSDQSASLPTNSTLTGGAGTFSATLSTFGSQTISVFDAAAITVYGRSAPITVTAPATHFVISAPSSTTAGSVFIYAVTATDALGNTAEGYAGIVHISSSDAQASLSADATLTGGIGFFAAALRTAGHQTLIATDTINGSLSGTSAAIAVTAVAANHFALSAPAAAITGIAANFTVTAKDPYNNTATGYAGTVHFTSSDASAALPADTTLTGGVGVFSATLKSVGSQTLTATDVANTGITGTSNAIATRGLTVASLTPTPTGFVATFDKPFDPSLINLYDANGNWGPDDVLLTGPGAPQISIHGSLMVDPTDTTITFVKTSDLTGPNFNPATGVLAAGTYTVTLRSASNGFKDLLGVPLDGANTGNVAGSNYIATFVVTAPPVVVGLPAFARGPDSNDAVNLPAGATTAGIPINVSNGTGVTSGKFTLQYNSALLTIAGANVNSSLTGASLSLDSSSTAGNAIIDFSSPTPLATSTAVVRLGGLVAFVPNSAIPLYKSKALLHWSGVQLNTTAGPIPVEGDDAIEVVAYLGDTNGDGTLSGGDGANISSLNTFTNSSTNTLGGFSAYPLADPTIIGDLNNNGNSDSADVTLLNSYLSGTPHAQIPTPPAALAGFTVTGPDPALSLPTTLQAALGSTVIVPVNIDTAHPAGSTGATEAILALKFNPLVFSVSAADVQLGSLPAASQGWQLTMQVNSQTGQIGIDLFGSSPIQTTASGSLVLISLHVRDTAPVGSTGLTLMTQANPTGQREFVTTMGDSQGAFILHFAAGSGQVAVGGDTAGAALVNPPLLGMGAAFAQNPPAAALNAFANHHSPLVATDIVEQVFGDIGNSLAAPSMLGQPDAILEAAFNEQTGSLAPPKAWLEPLGVLQSDFAPGEVLQPDGQARPNALGGLSDTDLDGREDFFAPEEASDSFIHTPQSHPQ